MIAIIDYNAGNTRSVINALTRIGAEFVLTSDADTIRKADKVVLPGVGHAAYAMDELQRRGMVEVITALRQPVLGICLGMQLLFDSTAEGDTHCLGIVSGRVEQFDNTDLLVPQMGWNSVAGYDGCSLFQNISNEEYFYLVHSYYAPVGNSTVATSFYGEKYTVAVQKKNFYGVQFHPEKSGPAGEQLLLNFLNIEQ